MSYIDNLGIFFGTAVDTETHTATLGVMSVDGLTWDVVLDIRKLNLQNVGLVQIASNGYS
jgi:hypothetical protein